MIASRPEVTGGALARLWLMVMALVCLGAECDPDPTALCPMANATACATNRCADLDNDAFNCGACDRVCPMGQRCLRGVCALCPSGQTACVSGAVNRCVDTQTDSQNCGACFNTCRTGEEACVAGVCTRTAPCNPPFSQCGRECPNLQNNARHCGRCGNDCGSGQCVAGACVCSAPLTVCGGVCRDLSADLMNCGACGNVCPTGTMCIRACPRGVASCVDESRVTRCVDLRDDPGNCGSVGRSCASSAGCENGNCVLCGSGSTRCPGRCVFTQTDVANCGACGNACPSGMACLEGRCVVGRPTCSPIETDCTPTAPTPTCVVLNNSTSHCGRCGNACPAPINGTVACFTNVCRINSCHAGFADCNRDTADGCEVDTTTSAAHCGRCDNACPAGQSCVRGACTSVRPTCPAGQTDCAPLAPVPTCVNLQTDNVHCGACANACAAGRTCVGGSCTAPRPTCPSGQTDCTPTAPTPTCVTLATSTSHCGRCGNACPTGQGCASGVCGGAACPTGQTRCGSVCVNAQTDASNCGRCGNVCPAGQSCAAGVCAAPSGCPAGQSPCGGRCVNTFSNASHCGGCNRPCTTGRVCASGRCSLACPAPLTSCPLPDSGSACVNVGTDVENCGACGARCAAGQYCARTSPTAAQCFTAATSCASAGARRHTCEGVCVDHLTDTSHCGGCNLRCMTNQACVDGACVVLP